MHIYLIGTGPGNPDLLTVQAKEAIEPRPSSSAINGCWNPLSTRENSWSPRIAAMKSAAWLRRGPMKTVPWPFWYRATSAFSAWPPY